MGGNGPLVILDDADIDAAVRATITACFLNAGQSCTAGERVLVDRSVHDAYLERLVDAVGREVRLGDPLDGSDDDGPAQQRADRREGRAPRRARRIERGARSWRAATGAATSAATLFFEPTSSTG